MPSLHPTALVDPAALLADDVQVGPFAIIGPDVVLGAGCVVGPQVHLLGHLTAGKGNRFHTGCVLGDTPQHLAYAGEPTKVIIGDDNTFRELVTVHRGMPSPAAGQTVIGNNNLFMVGSHVAHDCRVGNHCIFANSAVLGGHASVQDGAFLSGNTCVHQNCRVGRLAMISGTTSISQDLPPFWIVQEINIPRGVNVVGMRRAGIPAVEINAIRRAYRIINKQGLTVSAACSLIEQQEGEHAAIQELLAFIRSSKRGIVTSERERDDG
jgi:UDP-N-acetylglucosamine acyltransferase